jgi:hypothetical protein
MNLYLAAVTLGVGLILIWLSWLLTVRLYLRRTRSKPGILLSILQVIIVLLMMQLAYRVSDHYFAWANITSPDVMKTFRRIWILVLAAGMVASIQIFLDIRKMAEPVSAPQRLQPMNRAGRRRRR